MPDKMPVLREPDRRRRGGKKLLVILFILFIVILCVLFFNSSISKISSITVEGQRYMEAADIQKASGVTVGEAFFGITAKTIEARVSKLKAVESTQVIKSFPGKIRIVIKELPTVAYEVSSKGEITAIMSNGTSLLAGGDIVVDKPILSGWKPDDPVRIELCKQLAAIPAQSLSDFSEIMPAASASYKDRIKIYTRTRFEVITAVSLLQAKIAVLNAVIETQEPGLITLLLADKYASFSPVDTENSESTEKETTQ